MKNIQIFTDVSELLLYLDCDLTEEQEEFFSHILDFESMDMLLIDNETVVTRDTLNGDVLDVRKTEDYIWYAIGYWVDAGKEKS